MEGLPTARNQNKSPDKIAQTPSSKGAPTSPITQVQNPLFRSQSPTKEQTKEEELRKMNEDLKAKLELAERKLKEQQDALSAQQQQPPPTKQPQQQDVSNKPPPQLDIPKQKDEGGIRKLSKVEKEKETTKPQEKQTPVKDKENKEKTINKVRD